jgi:hypothetical protein
MNFNKTDKELEQMTEEELFEYLDAKAAHLSKHTSPLSAYKTKRFAAISSAVSGHKFDYDSVKKIAKENQIKGYEKFINDKNK